MRILQVSKLYPPFFGGIETVVYDLVSELKHRDDCDIDILCVSHNRVSSCTMYEGVRVFREGTFAHLSSAYLSFGFLSRWREIRNNYDVVHIHLPNPLATLALKIFPTKAKVVLHWHSDIIKQSFLKKVIFPIENNARIRSDIIIATSNNYLDYSKDLSKFKSKSVVIPIGIQSDKYKKSPCFNELYNNYKNKKVIFSLGRHVYYKGFQYLIDSAKYLPDDYIVLIGGTGDLTSELESLIKKNDLSQKVFLLGRIDNDRIGDYFHLASVFCLPSIEKSEAFGVVQLEAMSIGLPIVSSNILGSGVGWVNKDGITGFTVRPKDSMELSKKIIYACEEPRICKKSIISYFNSNFTRKKMSDSIFKLYKELL